jgi:hypothetical protein
MVHALPTKEVRSELARIQRFPARVSKSEAQKDEAAE